MPRVPLLHWSVRVTMDLERAEPMSYLNEVTLDPIGNEPRMLHGAPFPVYRANAVAIPCGDFLLTATRMKGAGVGPTLHLPTFLRRRAGQAEQPRCQNVVILDGRQAHYLQVSNYYRKAILCVQTCSEDCAKDAGDAIEASWLSFYDLMRRTRPLRPLPANNP